MAHQQTKGNKARHIVGIQQRHSMHWKEKLKLHCKAIFQYKIFYHITYCYNISSLQEISKTNYYKHYSRVQRRLIRLTPSRKGMLRLDLVLNGWKDIVQRITFGYAPRNMMNKNFLYGRREAITTYIKGCSRWPSLNGPCLSKARAFHSQYFLRSLLHFSSSLKESQVVEYMPATYFRWLMNINKVGFQVCNPAVLQL